MILTKTPFKDNIGHTAAGSKLLYIEDGTFHLHINGYGSLKGKAFVSDGREHIIAFRFYKDINKW